MLAGGRRPSPTLWLSALAIVAGVLTSVALAAAASTERNADRRAAMTAADRLATELTAVTSSVAGVDVLAVDGRVDDREFATFGSSVVASSGLVALAYIERIDGRDRDGWERATGLEIKDTDGEGGFVPSPERPVHAVVTRVEPVAPATTSVLGFDVESDPVRAEGVRRAGRTRGATLVGPVRLASGGEPGVFLLIAVRDPDDEAIGYVASGISLDGLAEQIEALPGVGRIGITVDGIEVRDAGGDGSSASFDLAGRTFTVVSRDPRSFDWLLPLSLGVGTVLLTGAAIVAWRRSQVARRRVERAALRSVAVAELAEHLVNETTTASVIDAVVARAGPIVGARHVNVARRLPSDPSKLEVTHGGSMASDLAARFAFQDLEADLPLPESVRTGASIFIADRTSYARRYPHVVDDVVAAGIHSVCCVPLSLGNDGSVGAIGFAFDEPCEPDDQEEIEATVLLVSQLAGRAFERAQAREIVQERVDLLSEFARALTTVRTTTDVGAYVSRLVPALLDVEHAELVGDACVGPTTRSYPTSSSGGEHLELALGRGRRWSSIDETLTVTVADLVGGALTRTRLHDQEQAVLQRLQDTLLTPPPAVDGFDIAVGYRSALEAVGMGGDWYTVIDSPDSIHVVIGDVAGHGPGAVALMAEVKTVMRHLLTNGTPLEDAIAQADRTLQRRRAYASVCAFRVDKHSEIVEFVNAGHVPPVLQTSRGTVVLPEVHRPWLGVEHDTPVSRSCVMLHPGDVLLAYTDGLVEERGELIDSSILRRFGGVDHEQRAASIVDGLIGERERTRSATSVDDDIAVVAVRRLGQRRATPIAVGSSLAGTWARGRATSGVRAAEATEGGHDEVTTDVDRDEWSRLDEARAPRGPAPCG